MASDSPKSDLKDEIVNLRRAIDRSNRWHNVFWRSIVSGIGTALGATIIAALALTFLLQLLHNTGLDRFFNST